MGIVIMEFVQYSGDKCVCFFALSFLFSFLEGKFLSLFWGARVSVRALRDACKVPSTLMGKVKKTKKASILELLLRDAQRGIACININEADH